MPNARTAVVAIVVALQLSACIELPRTVADDATLPSVTLDGYRFHAEAFGSARSPVVIVLHGGPGADYRYLLPLAALADDYRVIFYDQRGTGLSPRVPSDAITVDRFIADLDAFVRHFGTGQPVNLIGHSWGAMLASAYAGRHPTRVARMVLAEPQFLDASSVHSMFAFPGWRVVFGVAHAWLDKWRVVNKSDPYARDDYFVSRLIMSMQASAESCKGAPPDLELWRSGAPVFDATIGRMNEDHDFAATLDFARGLDEFHGEALFLTGECNRLFGTEYQRPHLRFFKRVALAEIRQAGHFMFNDQPERSLSRVREFLAEGLTVHTASSR